jgi:hypothetical protein
LLPLCLVLAACSSDGSTDGSASGSATPDGGGAEPGHVVLRFQLGGSAVSSRNLVDPLEGPVYGAIYDVADVTQAGPADGAVSVVSVRVDSVDLRQQPLSEATWEGELRPGGYTFLGFWDIDHSSSPDDPNLGPENGDPVPLADTNQFQVEAGETTEVTATFEIIYAFD